MTIIIDQNTVAVFQVNVIGGNLLGAVRRQDGKVRITIRIRMQVDDKVWDSKDQKSWYEVETQEDENSAAQKLRLIFQMAPGRMGPIHEIWNTDGPENMMEAILKLPGMHKMDLPPRGKRH